MYMNSVLKHLIHQEASFPALKLVWDEQVDGEEFGELPKITPSHFFNENRLSTEERHTLLCRQQRRMTSRVPGAEVVVEPPIIVFQNFQFGETYSFPIVVRNISKNSQKVALLMDESLAFKFDECSQRVAKFPCGMCITAVITFTPESATKDCYHRLLVSTNTKKVSVPIIAIGARPLLNTPDSLVISDAPVRHWTVKPVTVLNTGKTVANFTLSATGAFCVKPEKGVVPPNQAFTFEVFHYSQTIDSHEGSVCLKYDNGEMVYMYLRGNTVNCPIQLSTSDVRCEDTYIDLQTRSTFFIENNSPITVKYFWKKYKNATTKPEKWGEIEDLVDVDEGLGDCEPDRLPDLTEGPIIADGVNVVADDTVFQCEKPFGNGKTSGDPLFSNDNFHVYPLFGEIKPNSKQEIHVVFSPTIVNFYEGIAYLDSSGLDHRLPFTLFGRGLGPKFRLAFEVLNVGDVALGGAHTYEVPVQNISEIPGVIQCDGLFGAPSGMGMKIEPLVLEILPGQYAAFYVNFTCTGKPGPFEDEIKFFVPQTGDVFYVTVKGQITYPSIRFANADAQLGNLSYGFPKTYYIPLVNDSMNFVDVELKMESDGVDPPVDYTTILKSFKFENLRFEKQPAEFKISPSKFTLRPKGLQKVQLTMYPNQVREIRNKLNCWITDEDGNDVETVATINLRGMVIVPPLQAIQDFVHMKDCYLQYPYQGEFIIKNTSELPVIYVIVQKPSTHLKVESDSFVGVAEPWTETEIPFEVVCISSGEAVAYFDVYAVGNDAKMLSLTCRCESIPSKVEASQRNADFGKIEVMDEKVLTVDIVNTSPLNFPFTSAIFLDEPSDKGEIWKVDPEVGMLPAQSRVTFMVTLLLKEVGFHYAGIRVQMTEPLKHIIEVRMKALGIGTPLVFNPPLETKCTIHFGTTFVKQEKVMEYEVSNRGVNPRVLEWKPAGERGPLNRPWETKALKKQQAKDAKEASTQPSRKTLAAVDKDSPKRDQNGHNMKQKPPVRPAFIINPMKLVLQPGASAKITISSFSATPKILEESWCIWSFVPATKGLQVEDEGGEHGSKKNLLASKSKKFGPGADKDKKRKFPGNEPQNLHLRPAISNEVKLYAIFEAPGLRFSKRLVNFVIEATPTHEDYVMEEPLRIENVGTLPLRVKLHTKFPFSFCQKVPGSSEESPHDEGVYPFDTQKALNFKIQFDGRHLRKELGVVTFDGKLEAQYEGLMGIEYVDLHGEVRFPQVNMDRTSIDFGTITNGMEAVEQINVTNTGPFCLTYKWYLKPGATSIQVNPEPAWVKDLYFNSYRPSMKQKLFKFMHENSLTDPKIRNTLLPPERKDRLRYSNASQDQISKALGLPSGGHERSTDSNYQDFTQFLEEKMYRSRMMEFMGLKDAEFEAEDEVNYLAYYNQNSALPKEEFRTNEMIDIIPLAGVIESGKSQSFTVVFYGYPDIDFKTSLVLYIEGGARKTVEVTGKTVHPKTLPSRKNSFDKQ